MMSRDLNWLKRPIAHRGLHDAGKGVIENTATAFAQALEAGYAIETDLRASGDGEAMVFHDATLDRLTKKTGDVAAHSARELQRISYAQNTDRIQTLAKLLEQVAGAVPLVMEIKTTWTHHGPLEQRIAALLMDYAGPAAVMSFDPLSMAAFAAAAPQIARGLVAEDFHDLKQWSHLTAGQRFSMRHLLSSTVARPQFIAYDINALPALAPQVARRLFGCPLLTWTVRTPEQKSKAERYADAIIFEGFRP